MVESPMKYLLIGVLLASQAFALTPMTWFGLARAVSDSPEIYRSTKRAVKVAAAAAKKVAKKVKH